MFDRYVDAFMSGQIPITIETLKTGPDEYTATFTAPNGDTISAKDSSLNQAHRSCADLVRDAVVKREIMLGR